MNMREYIITLFLVCCVAAIIRAVGKDSATKKYIELVCALCVISALVLPIFGANIDDFDIGAIFDETENKGQNYDEIYKNYLLQEGKSSAENAIASDVCKQLGVSAGGVSIRLTLNEDGTEIVAATAIVSGEAVNTDPSLIKQYISQALGTDCEIGYKLFDE